MTADCRKEHPKGLIKPTLIMRLTAGVWFGTVFGSSALIYLIYQSRSHLSSAVAIRSRAVFYWIIPVILAASVCGGLVGGRILTRYDAAPVFVAAWRGAIIGLVSLVVFILALALEGTLHGARHGLSQFAWLAIYLSLFWGWLAAVPVVALGSTAGILLHLTKRLSQAV